MPGLKLDLSAMDDAKTNLSALRTELLGMGDFNSGGAADATGDRLLGGKIGDFADAWSIRRDEIAEQLQFLSDAAGAISMTFSELDDSLAGALTDAGA